MASLETHIIESLSILLSLSLPLLALVFGLTLFISSGGSEYQNQQSLTMHRLRVFMVALTIVLVFSFFTLLFSLVGLQHLQSDGLGA